MSTSEQARIDYEFGRIVGHLDELRKIGAKLIAVYAGLPPFVPTPQVIYHAIHPNG